MLLRLAFLLVGIPTLLFIRIHLIGRGRPTFIDSDNPAAFSPQFQTRLLTYTYVWSVNLWLLILPSQLCHDWSMGSVPLVESATDPRVAFSVIALLAVVSISSLLAYRGGYYIRF